MAFNPDIPQTTYDVTYVSYTTEAKPLNVIALAILGILLGILGIVEVLVLPEI